MKMVTRMRFPTNALSKLRNALHRTMKAYGARTDYLLRPIDGSAHTQLIERTEGRIYEWGNGTVLVQYSTASHEARAKLGLYDQVDISAYGPEFLESERGRNIMTGIDNIVTRYKAQRTPPAYLTQLGNRVITNAQRNILSKSDIVNVLMKRKWRAKRKQTSLSDALSRSSRGHGAN